MIARFWGGGINPMDERRDVSDRELMGIHARTILVQIARLQFMLALIILALVLLTVAFVAHILAFLAR